MVVAPEDVSPGAGSVDEVVPRGPRSPARTILVAMVATLLVLEVAVRSMAGSLPDPLVWSTPEMQYKVEQMDARGAATVALVGSSVVDAGLDPSQFGADAYNAALGAGSMRMIADFTREVVVPRLDPDVVVVGVSARELNHHSTTVAQHEEEFLAAPAVRQALGQESLIDLADRWLGDVSHLFRYRSALRDPGSWSRDDEWDDSATRADGLYLGFQDASYRGGEAAQRSLAERAVPDFRIGQRQLAELRRLLTWLIEDGRRVVVTIGPVTEDFLSAFPRGALDHTEFVAAVRSLAAEVGVELVDTGVWDPTVMADPVHANAAGAARFSTAVAEAVTRT